MIRPFDWRDLALIHSVRNDGVCLDTQLAYTRGMNALQNVLLDPFTPGRTVCTLVARADDRNGMEAVGQFVIHEARRQAHLAYIGPLQAIHKDIGLRLLEALARYAGEQLAHCLTAEIDENDPLFERLREAGFAIYARQRIWLLDKDIPHADRETIDGDWSSERDQDQIAIHNLYHSLVPGLVQQVELPPTPDGQGLVYRSHGDVLGYLDVRRGPNGTWIQPYFHPAAHLSDQVVSGFLDRFTPSPTRPLFVCVRSYQGGLGSSLANLGFEPCSDQAVMVKRLTAGVRQKATKPLPALDGTQPEATAPFTNVKTKSSS
ncbi:MAG: hypothetical protein PVH60_09790 [Anaerolineales bacterium]